MLDKKTLNNKSLQKPEKNHLYNMFNKLKDLDETV